MRVMIVCGSLRQASGTRAALRLVAAELATRAATVDVYDLREHRLPMYDPDAESLPPEVTEFRNRAQAADAFILGTPEYHNAMSGALKNALDWVGSRQFRGKPVGLLACAGGGKGGINAVNSLRSVVRGVMALAVPEQAIVDEDDFDADMELTSTDRRGRIIAMVGAVVRYTRFLELEKAGE